MKKNSRYFRRLIHFGFKVGVLFKGLDGVLEIFGAVLLWFLSPEQMNRVVALLTQHELSEDPKDFIANHLRWIAGHLSVSTQAFTVVYLLSHGVLKLFLVWALLKPRLWAYPAAIMIFSIFGLYQAYRYALSHSVIMFALILLDAFVILLTWAEYATLYEKHGSKS